MQKLGWTERWGVGLSYGILKICGFSSRAGFRAGKACVPGEHDKVWAASRDVSTGIAGATPSSVATILSDPSDSLADRSRDPKWQTLNQEVFSANFASIGAVYHLHGHFYIVWRSWG